MRFVFTAILIIILFLNSCAPTKEFKKFSINNLNELEDLLKIREKKIHTFSGSGDLILESPGIINSGKFKVYIKKPDSLLIQLKGPFGTSVGALMLSRENFIIVNNVENKIQTGSSDIKTIESVLNLPLTFDDILYVLTGSYPNSIGGSVFSNIEEAGSNYILKTENEKKELWINSGTGNISRYLETDNAGNVNIELNAKYFEKTGDISTPYWIRIVFPKQQRSLTIAYDDIKLNKPVNCSINIPGKSDN